MYVNANITATDSDFVYSWRSCIIIVVEKVMEDFQAAFVERHTDVGVLDTTNRCTTAMHLGGVAIECLLKAIVSASLPRNSCGEKEWKTETNDPGHTIYNPGHNYEAALRAY